MFKFRLQQLLNLRQQREREMTAAMTRAEAVRDAACAARDTLETARTTGRERLHAAHGTQETVGQLRSRVFVLDQLDEQVAHAATSVSEAEAETESARQLLSTAHGERRVLDRLRDRHEADWRTAEVQLDRQTMDAIALARFIQPASAPGDDSHGDR